MTETRTDIPETKSKGRPKPLKLPRLSRLELKKTIETGPVKQSFSHGRSKTVKVEVKRKRTYVPGTSGEMKETGVQLDFGSSKTKASPAPPIKEVEPEKKLVRELTKSERAARTRALEEANKLADTVDQESDESLVEATLSAPEEVVPIDSQEQLRRTEKGAVERRDEGKGQSKEEHEARRVTDQAVRQVTETGRRRQGVDEADEEAPDAPARARGKARSTAEKPATKPRSTVRRRGKLTISEALSEDGGGRVRSIASFRRRVEKTKRVQTVRSAQPAKKVLREVVVPESITASELANRMAERGADVVRVLMKMGVVANINMTIDQDTAELVASELGHKVKRVSASDVEIGLGGGPDDEQATLESRSPVVTVMGHVDHGKTSLLDALRGTDVASREAGGITQHIGAYQVEVASGAQITFIDTPGHEAFTAMRQRGAQVTDIVILVVAADDGVQPQTVEAINHAQAAAVPIIVAVNKCDKSDADPTRVTNGLLSHEVVVEGVGGEIQCVEVSALKKQGLDKLLEAILLQAELLELKANSKRSAYGAVIEAQLERGRGPVATVLVQRGTLKTGDIFVTGSEWGRVRALVDDRGKKIRYAGPSVPVEVLGLNGVPKAGDEFAVVKSEARAREVAEFRLSQQRDRRAAAGARGTLEQMFDQIAEGLAVEVPLVIKADMQGSVEAISGALEGLGVDEVKVRILHAAVGGITESDISLAGASSGLIIGFNVRANAQARDLAKRDNVKISYFTIIYDLVNDVKALMSGHLAPRITEEPVGSAEIREVFNITKIGRVAGCMVREGMLRRGSRARLLRDSMVVYQGSLGTLRRFKDDVREVREGYECGTSFENYNDIQVGDIIECFEVKEFERTL